MDMKLNVYMFLIPVIFLAGTLVLDAQESDRRDVRRGNRQFRDGNFKEAVVDYQKALLRDSTSFAASYNLANALYRMDNFQEAKAALDTVSETAPESAHAADYYYNAGNVAMALEDYRSAVESYKEALLRNPGDLDAKENYIYAKKKLEDQQDNSQNDQQDNKQDSDDNREDRQDKQQDQDNQNNQDSPDSGDRDNDRNDQEGESPQNQPKISKQAAQQMLNAIMAKEKETQDKVKKEKAAVMKSKQKEKNW